MTSRNATHPCSFLNHPALEASGGCARVNTSEVQVPALVIAAGADVSLAQAIGARFVLLEDEGHGIPVNPVWAQVTAQISEWLSRLEARRPSPHH